MDYVYGLGFYGGYTSIGVILLDLIEWLQYLKGMIDYTPLQRTLKKRSTSLYSFLKDDRGLSEIGYCNTRSVVTRTSTIDKICKRLGCKVEEVVRIEADDTKMRSRVKYLDSKVDFAPMFKIIEGKGLSMRGVSMAAGVSENTVQKIKAQNADCGAKPLYATVRKLARYLEVEPEDLYTVVGPV